MSLDKEWRPRVELWIAALESLFFKKIESVPMEAAFTYDQLTQEAARRLDYQPIETGAKWGRMWEYAWFRGVLTLPPEAENEVIVLQAGSPTPQWGGDPYGEWRFIVNGTEIGSRDWAHVYLRLTTKGRPGQTFELLAEAFGGPTRAGAGGGPALPGIPSIPPIPEKQRTMVDVAYGVWNEDVFQLWHDAKMLFGLRDLLDANSLRLSEIDAGLRDFTLIADPELPWDAFQKTVIAARDRLRPLLEAKNGTTAPVLYCVGHSHLDVVYQWPFAETERKVARTFSNQLRLLEDYPEYTYLQSMPLLYDAAKRRHPELYQRVKDAVKAGRWVAEGGMWTEADTNLAGGESLIRQFLHGKRFFKEEFDVDSVFAWLPDVFGYSGALPQIFAGCGMKYFASAKIYCLRNGGDPFPYCTFWWEGIDGTRVLSHFVAYYGEHTWAESLLHQWNQRPQKDSLRSRMMLYGHSDGGGGAERTHLENLRRAADLEGLPRTRHALPTEFFADLEKDVSHLPVYAGELYFSSHRGVYTTQAKLKLGNRRCEFALREAELWASAHALLLGAAYPADALDAAWKKTLFNQFHDVLPGSCIRRAAAEAEETYASALSEAREIANKATAALVQQENPGEFTIFNSLPFSYRALVPLPSDVSENGKDNQQTDGVTYVEVDLPSCGWQDVRSHAMAQGESGGVKATAKSLENSCMLVEFSPSGEIVRWLDKVENRELAAGRMNAFKLFRDTPRGCDAWDVDSHYELQPVELSDESEIEVIADGPLFASLRVRRQLHNSWMEQEIRLRRDSRVLEFRTKIVWRETHKLLKVCFPAAIYATEAIHEIQFGHLRRPTHRSRPFDRDRFEVPQQKWTALVEENRGVAVLNDCKYGINVLNNSLNLTLLRSPVAPDAEADRGEHEFTYALMFWNGSFSSSDVIQQAYILNAPPSVARGSGGRRELFSVDSPHVILETVKMAEDGSDDVILRLYEAHRTTTRCVLSSSIPFKSASQADMLETPGTALSMNNGGITVDFRPFEIKTVRLGR